MLVRCAAEKDIPAIEELLSQVLAVHHKGRPDIFKPNSRKYRREELCALLADADRPIFVAEEAGSVCGYAFCILTETKGDNILCDHKGLYIDDLCVNSDQRGLGVGKTLYTYVREYARSLGCYHITLNVWSCNPAAIAFYEKMGLSPQKTVMEAIL